jgi:hypothetical protein
MVTYKFKLIDSKVPVLRGKNIIVDSNVGGIKNIYKIYRVRPLMDKLLCTRIFWRPWKSWWDVKKRRLPAPYWGKKDDPLLNMWLVLLNDYPDPSKVRSILQEADTSHHTTTICGIEFLSQELNRNLKLNKSFYQSNFKRDERK